MSDKSRQGDWTKPAAMAIPKGGFFKDEVKQGRYGPVFPRDSGLLRLQRHREGHPRKGRAHIQPCQGHRESNRR